MSDKILFQTSRFKVKQPPKFQEDLSKISGINLLLNEDGFILESDPKDYVDFPEELSESEGSLPEDLAFFIQSHILETEIVEMTFVFMDGNVTDISTSFFLVSSIGIQCVDDREIFQKLKSSLYPRFAHLSKDIFLEGSNKWLKKGDSVLIHSQMENVFTNNEFRGTLYTISDGGVFKSLPGDCFSDL